MNKQDLFIRLLKENHITEEEFKFLYQDTKEEKIETGNDCVVKPEISASIFPAGIRNVSSTAGDSLVTVFPAHKTFSVSGNNE